MTITDDRLPAVTAGEQGWIGRAEAVERADAPIVSVIMIFLNAERFIGEAIESVLAQSYPNWELLLVDDGSSDASTEIALAYVARCTERIRYIRHAGHANRGMGASRNAGLAAARGDLIAFLDADDVYAIDRLARHVTEFQQNPALDVVISGELYWWSWASGADEMPGSQVDRAFVPPVTELVPFEPPDLLVIMLRSDGAATPSICSVSFRRDCVRRSGGVPEVFTGLYEDQALISKLLLAGRAVVVDKCLARYRQHPRSLTYRSIHRGEYRPGSVHEAERVYLHWLQEFVRESGRMTPDLAAALNGRLNEYDNRLQGRLREQASAVIQRLRGALRRLATGILPTAVLADFRAGRETRRWQREAARVREIEREVLSRRGVHQ